jgi:hypothetical protein
MDAATIPHLQKTASGQMKFFGRAKVRSNGVKLQVGKLFFSLKHWRQSDNNSGFRLADIIGPPATAIVFCRLSYPGVVKFRPVFDYERKSSGI